MKRIGLLFTLMSFAVLGFAQPKIQFDQTTHDFGNIKEEVSNHDGALESNVANALLSSLSIMAARSELRIVLIASNSFGVTLSMRISPKILAIVLLLE